MKNQKWRSRTPAYRIIRGLSMFATCFIWSKKFRRMLRRKSSLWGNYHNRFYSEKRFSKQEKRNQKLIMTLLVRDEETLIEDNIRFHISQGVDKIIVTDNKSQDGTRNILNKYEHLGWVEIIDELSEDYEQDKWVDRMIKIAIEKYNADWIINVDADEFFLSKTRNLKDALPNDLKPNILVCWWNWGWIQEEQNWWEVVEFVKPSNNNHKSIHSAKFYSRIGRGNHKVHMRKVHSPSITEDITLFHIQPNDFEKYRKRMQTAYLSRPKSRQKHTEKKFGRGYRETMLLPEPEARINYQKMVSERHTNANATIVRNTAFKDFMQEVRENEISNCTSYQIGSPEKEM